MNRLALSLTFLVGSLLYWHPLVPVAAIVCALVALSFIPDPPRAPRTAPMPSAPRRNWRWGLGLAITTWGPIPFITIRRRTR